MLKFKNTKKQTQSPCIKRRVLILLSPRGLIHFFKVTRKKVSGLIDVYNKSVNSEIKILNDTGNSYLYLM